MVDKEKLDLEIRLTAIEYLLINMGKAVYLTAQVPAEKMREMRESARTQLLGETFPGVDPSMGDHVGAELADRVEYLLGEIEILVADAYQQLDQQRKALALIRLTSLGFAPCSKPSRSTSSIECLK